MCSLGQQVAVLLQRSLQSQMRHPYDAGARLMLSLWSGILPGGAGCQCCFFGSHWHGIVITRALVPWIPSSSGCPHCNSQRMCIQFLSWPCLHSLSSSFCLWTKKLQHRFCRTTETTGTLSQSTAAAHAQCTSSALRLALHIVCSG